MQGITQRYAFTDNEAACSFLAALQDDPNCTLAAFGFSLAIGPNVNYGYIASSYVYACILMVSGANCPGTLACACAVSFRKKLQAGAESAGARMRCVYVRETVRLVLDERARSLSCWSCHCSALVCQAVLRTPSLGNDGGSARTYNALLVSGMQDALKKRY